MVLYSSFFELRTSNLICQILVLLLPLFLAAEKTGIIPPRDYVEKHASNSVASTTTPDVPDLFRNILKSFGQINESES